MILFVLFAEILKNTTTKIRSKHSIHGYQSRHLGLTKCILIFNIFFFVLFANIIDKKNKNTLLAASAPRLTFYWKVIPRPWPLADILAVHH